MKVETVEKQGQEYVLVPREQYNQLLEDAEMLRDVREFREAKAVDEETYPSEVVNRLILNEESPIRVSIETIEGSPSSNWRISAAFNAPIWRRSKQDASPAPSKP